MKNIKRLTDSDWEELASILSEEKSEQSEIYRQFTADDSYDTEKHWKNLKKMSSEKEIDVDDAWSRIQTRIKEAGDMTEVRPGRIILLRRTFMKIAATFLILLTLGSVAVYLNRSGALSKKIVASTNIDQKNLRIALPDGSNIYLNRNTELSYRASFGKHNRKVTLSGEAFFEITADAEKPFTVDAGNARIKVLGTSFNVITSNENNAVEVFVKTGRVMLTDNAGNQNLLIDPGYVGTVDSKQSERKLNNNPNYLSWNTEILVYDGQKLKDVFKDLKRVYNMDIVADEPDILEQPWTITIDNESEDTIIRVICASFILSYTRDGNIYHLTKK